jgi:putative lipoprotein (rSAM/lipoprotein system)
MKIKYLKLKNWLLVTLMGAFGLSSCHCHKEVEKTEPKETPEVNPREEIRLMYGVPTMNFMIRGQVKDADGRPVKNIRVNMLERNMEVKDGELQGDPAKVRQWLDGTAVSTDRNGNFEINNSGIPQEEVKLMVRDVDGQENGEFKNQVFEMKVEQSDVDRTGAGGWNHGTFKKEVEIQLDNK